jgi:C4-type Zn-finger protein
MQIQPKLQPEIPIVTCPHCEKKFPMAVRSVSLPLRGKNSEVEFVCANCGTTLVQELA